MTPAGQRPDEGHRRKTILAPVVLASLCLGMTSRASAAHSEDEGSRRSALMGLASPAAFFGDLGSAKQDLTLALEVRRRTGSSPGRAEVSTLGLAMELDRADRAHQSALDALALAAPQADAWRAAHAGARDLLALAEASVVVVCPQLRDALPVWAVDDPAFQTAPTTCGPDARAPVEAWMQAVVHMDRSMEAMSELPAQEEYVRGLKDEVARWSARRDQLMMTWSVAAVPRDPNLLPEPHNPALQLSRRFGALEQRLGDLPAPIRRDAYCEVLGGGAIAAAIAGDRAVTGRMFDALSAHGGPCTEALAGALDIPEVLLAWSGALAARTTLEPATLIVEHRPDEQVIVDGTPLLGLGLREHHLEAGGHRVEIHGEESALLCSFIELGGGERALLWRDESALELHEAPSADAMVLPPRAVRAEDGVAVAELALPSVAWTTETGDLVEPKVNSRVRVGAGGAWQRYAGRDHAGLSLSVAARPWQSKGGSLAGAWTEVGFSQDLLHSERTYRYTDSLSWNVLLMTRGLAAAGLTIGPVELGVEGTVVVIPPGHYLAAEAGARGALMLSSQLSVQIGLRLTAAAANSTGNPLFVPSAATVSVRLHL